MVDDVVADARKDMEKAISALEKELARVRTGRANLAILDGIKVEYYGHTRGASQLGSAINSLLAAALVSYAVRLHSVTSEILPELVQQDCYLNHDCSNSDRRRRNLFF